jgi:hypothetical protein
MDFVYTHIKRLQATDVVTEFLNIIKARFNLYTFFEPTVNVRLVINLMT